MRFDAEQVMLSDQPALNLKLLNLITERPDFLWQFLQPRSDAAW